MLLFERSIYFLHKSRIPPHNESMSKSSLDDTINAGETVVAILKTDLGPTRIIDGAEPSAPKSEVPNRYEITLTIKDIWSNQSHTYQVKP